MSGISAYNIAFKGLALGKTEFEYTIGKPFFEYFDGGIVEEGDVRVKVVLDKQSNLLTLDFKVKGVAYVACDRCLETYPEPIKNKAKVYVKYGESSFEEGDDVIWVDVNESQINVAQMIYDYILLALPIRTVHPEDENGKSQCNPAMIERIESLNYFSEETEEEETTDSRWNELKKLLETDKKLK
ncbi:MAG: YceD family protein [Mangrovibacterium sp.]